MENTILDQELDPREQPDLTVASTGKRFVNYIIDILGFYLCAIVIGVFLGITAPSLFEEGNYDENPASEYFWGILLILTYYTLMEGGLKGKTLGKYVTRTRAVTEDGQPVDFQKAFLRSLCRLIPFEALSFLFGPLGWHDTITKTMVVEDFR